MSTQTRRSVLRRRHERRHRNWHVGSPMDQRARGALNRAGFNGAGSLAAYADRAYLDRQDVVIGMTREHVHEVKKRLSNPSTEVILLRNLIEPGVTSTCSILTTATSSSSTSVSRQLEQGSAFDIGISSATGWMLARSLISGKVRDRITARTPIGTA